jgi:phage terminase large subunit
LYTDYNNLAVVYDCSVIAGFIKVENMWVLTRKQQETNELIKKAIEVLNQNKIGIFFMFKVDQSDCKV